MQALFEKLLNIFSEIFEFKSESFAACIAYTTSPELLIGQKSLKGYNKNDHIDLLLLKSNHRRGILIHPLVTLLTH